MRQNGNKTDRIEKTRLGGTPRPTAVCNATLEPGRANPPGEPHSRSGSKCLIGWGNELRGDDGAGRLVVRRVAETDNVHVLDVHQLTPELSLCLAEADEAVFVDAYPATESDTVRIVELRSEAEPNEPHSPHRFTPGHLLHLAATLYGHAPRARLIAIPATRFDHGAPLSDGTRSGMEAAWREITLWMNAGTERAIV